jgi:chromosome segregation ATPase
VKIWKRENRNDANRLDIAWREYIEHREEQYKTDMQKLETKLDLKSREIADLASKEAECQRQAIRTGERLKQLEDRCNSLTKQVEELKQKLGEKNNPPFYS